MLFLLIFMANALAIRLALLAIAAHAVSWDASLLSTFCWGLLYDLGAGSLFSIPLILVLTLLPMHIFERKWTRGAVYGVGWLILFILLFGSLAEWLFWDEFEARFNFIAVDYLVYTTEVIGNIRESYPLPVYFSALAAASIMLQFAILRTGLPQRWLASAAEPWRSRWLHGALWLCLPLVFGFVLNERQLPDFANNYNRELAKNGSWSLVAAFQNNEIDYEQFYPTLGSNKIFNTLRHELVEDGSRSPLVNPAAKDSLRSVQNPGPEIYPNVIQITVESLSADFLGSYNPDSPLTPNLDNLATKSLVFDNFYATGTRTDRGMEALSLSLPPTPGRSLIKRQHNEHLFSVGSVFRSKGYETAFLYGGYGYFDNMNYFFGNNGYRVVDRGSVDSSEVSFANAWGACDEDLFNWTITEADRSFATGKPFHFFVMTTSNHRPYTFPEGRIDLPPKISGRSGAVKYTDYALGRLLSQASTRPWFKNTIFVIVADHCASSAGQSELPIQKYHIPLLIYAPGGQIKPGHITTLASQIDFGPTLFGLLNWSYKSRFFGQDVRRIKEEEGHAFVGNYQKIGHIEGDLLTVLKPLRQHSSYLFDFETHKLETTGDDAEALDETISYYQAASQMYHEGTYREITAVGRPHPLSMVTTIH